MLRYLLFWPEMFVYGISYAWLKFLIRAPKPLAGDYAWKAVSQDAPPAIDWFRKNWPIRPLRNLIIAAKMKQDHALGIAEHYDVSNDFYKLFLDRRYMFYTCADFHSPDETIEEAQQHKADYILGLIDPKPGEKILELGCGWGAMLKRISEATGDKENLYGLTLSKEQKAYNDQHNGFNVEFDDFVSREYKPEEFDAIYSIGAWEHVKPNEVKPLLKKLYRALKPGGRLVQHFFCPVNDIRMATVACSQIYFPGSMGQPFRFQWQANEEAGFRVTHLSVHDYRPTLRAWYDRLEENREEALRLVDVPTFNRYMTFFPASWRYFDDKIGILTRWVLRKPAAPAGKSD